MFVLKTVAFPCISHIRSLSCLLLLVLLYLLSGSILDQAHKINYCTCLGNCSLQKRVRAVRAYRYIIYIYIIYIMYRLSTFMFSMPSSAQMFLAKNMFRVQFKSVSPDVSHPHPVMTIVRPGPGKQFWSDSFVVFFFCLLYRPSNPCFHVSRTFDMEALFLLRPSTFFAPWR